MQSEDLPAADEIRALAGWNQTLADWRRFLALSPDTCLVAEVQGRAVGTAVLTVHGPTLAWVGMVLVHPDHRRMGIGKQLMERCLGFADQLGIQTVALAATPAGKPLYESLGFVAQAALSRWESPGPPRPTGLAEDAESRLRVWSSGDNDRVESLDASAFGVSRRRLRNALSTDSVAAWVCESPSGQIGGYGFARAGVRASYLGPVVARSPRQGFRLVEVLLGGMPADSPVYWDFHDSNQAAAAWAQEHGFTRQRPLTLMFRGGPPPTGEERLQFALAGPSVG